MFIMYCVQTWYVVLNTEFHLFIHLLQCAPCFVKMAEHISKFSSFYDSRIVCISYTKHLGKFPSRGAWF